MEVYRASGRTGKVGSSTVSWRTPGSGRRDLNGSAGNGKPPKMKLKENAPNNMKMPLSSKWLLIATYSSVICASLTIERLLQ